jgi:hypothetical protein
MPIPYFDFTRAPLQRLQPKNNFGNILSNALNSYSEGKSQRQGFEKGKEEIESRRLSNENQQILNALMKDYEEEKIKADLSYKKALTEHQKRLGSGYSELTGSRNPYYGLPEQAKLMLQQHEINEGFLPGSNGKINLTPEEKEKYTQLNELKMQKMSTDSDTRRRALLAENLVKAIQNTNIDDLTRYSGPAGQAKLKIEQAKDLSGNPSEEYLRYKEALTTVTIEAKELRQALGESIQPEVKEQLEKLTNPTGFFTSPESARRQIQRTREVIQKQMDTFRSGLKRPIGYGKENSINQNQKKMENYPYSTEENKIGMVTIRNKKTGETKTIPYEEAKSMGAI